MIDLSQSTFIIPIRIESSDRLRNVITTSAFLLENFKTNIIIKEVDSESIFQRDALPIIKDIVDVEVDIKHIFERSEEPLFHRQKVLNEMIMEADTEIVVNYDCDAILPLDSYKQAYDMIMNRESEVVYPYGRGQYQYRVFADDDTVSNFLESYNYQYLIDKSKRHDSEFGWIQFFKRDVYVEGGMENENFKAYAPEDKERFYRYKTLGYSVGRIDSDIYHLEHARGENSWFTNPHMQSNMDLWDKLQNMNKSQLIEYYSNQQYLKKYNG